MSQNKSLLILSLVIMTALTQAGLVLYTPSFVKLAQSFHVASHYIQVTLSAYLLGFGLSQLVYGYFSDIYGRKGLLLFGVALFTLSAFLSAFCHTYVPFLISRILQGVGAGSCMVLSRAIVRDCFSGKEYLSAVSYLSSGFAIGLGVTPVIGGIISHYLTWQGNFIFLALFGLMSFILFSYAVPKSIKSHTQKPLILATFKNSLMSMQFVSYLICGVFAYGVVIAYNTICPFLFQGAMHINAIIYGTLTLITAVSYYLGTMCNRALIHQKGANAIIRLGILLIILSGGLLVLGYYILPHQIIYIFPPIVLAVFGQALVWSNCIGNALAGVKGNVGLVAAIFSFLQMILVSLLSFVFALPKDFNALPIALIISTMGVLAYVLFISFIGRKTE